MSNVFLNKGNIACLLLVCLISTCGLAQGTGGKDLFPAFQKPVKYPALTPDGDYLIFLAEEGTSVKAYEARRSGGAWSQPAPFDFINKLIVRTGNEVGGFSFNHDGSVLYFHAKMSNFFDVWFSRRTREGWSEPKQIGRPVSTEADLFSPSISSDNKTLFVLKAKQADKGKHGESCKELLLFEKNREGEWSGPKYLPKEFNVGCQETPFFAADNNSLYFSSRRLETDKATGKKVSEADNYNIYFARRIDENNWYYPVYIPGINTEFDELSPMLNSAGDYFVFTSKSAKKSPAKPYTAPLPFDKKSAKTFTVKGAITDLYSGGELEADIGVRNAVTSVSKGEFTSTDEGNYAVILTQGTFYKIDFSKPGYSHTYFFRNLVGDEKEAERRFDVKLYDHVKLELNIYDNELFYPVSPDVRIIDSLLGQPISSDRIQRGATGKYDCKLDIGRIYKIEVRSESFEPYASYFDLRTDVLYSDFEKSIEVKASRKAVTLNVVDENGASVLPVNIDIKNIDRDEDRASLLTHDAGTPKLQLRKNNGYELNVTKLGYTYYNTSIHVTDTRNETMTVELRALTGQTKMVFNNITFETNSAELNAESYDELNRLAGFIKDNVGIKIEISAHTDDVGSQEYNQRLSNKRAESVVKFLAGNDIPAERMVSKGYGKLQPLVPNSSDENRAKNRRVEIKIIENTTN